MTILDGLGRGAELYQVAAARCEVMVRVHRRTYIWVWVWANVRMKKVQEVAVHMQVGPHIHSHI